MTRVRCPQERCIFWLDGWCDSDEIELDPNTLACITFEEVDLERGAASTIEDDELEWEDDESIFDDDLDESLYGYEEEEDEEDEEDLVVEDEDWSL